METAPAPAPIRWPRRARPTTLRGALARGTLSAVWTTLSIVGAAYYLHQSPDLLIEGNKVPPSVAAARGPMADQKFVPAFRHTFPALARGRDNQHLRQLALNICTDIDTHHTQPGWELGVETRTRDTLQNGPHAPAVMVVHRVIRLAIEDVCHENIALAPPPMH